MLFAVIKWMIVSNKMVCRILAITLFAITAITAIIIFFIGIFHNINGFSSGVSMTPELMVLVLKSSFSSGDKLSFSGDMLCSPELPKLFFFYLYYGSIVF